MAIWHESLWFFRTEKIWKSLVKRNHSLKFRKWCPFIFADWTHFAIFGGKKEPGIFLKTGNHSLNLSERYLYLDIFKKNAACTARRCTQLFFSERLHFALKISCSVFRRSFDAAKISSESTISLDVCKKTENVTFFSPFARTISYSEHLADLNSSCSP